MSELQDAIRKYDETGSAYGNVGLFVDAARRVANLDMEAAARFYSDEVGRRSGSSLTWEAMYEEEQIDFLRVSTGAVNAALGITTKEDG